MSIEKNVADPADKVPVDGDVIRSVKNASGYCFKEARLSTTGSGDIEHNKYVGQMSTIMRAFSSKGGDLLSHLDKNDEAESEINVTSLEQILVNNHDVAAKKGKIKGLLTFEHISRISRTCKKILNNYDFILHLKLLIYEVSCIRHWVMIWK